MSILVSNITVCFNDKEGLIKTLDSLLCQSFRNYEVVIIDGGSTDGTTKVIESYEAKFQNIGVNFQAISEKDTGIYNAMNKGIRFANGKWFIFMNSGDCYSNASVLKNVFTSEYSDDTDILYGDYGIYKLNQLEKGISDLHIKHKKALPLSSFPKEMITKHQAFFTKGNLFKEKPYDESFKIIADYNWYLGAFIEKKNFQYIPYEICLFDKNGVSNKKLYDVVCEAKNIRSKYGIVKDSKIIFSIKKCIGWIIQKMVYSM